MNVESLRPYGFEIALTIAPPRSFSGEKCRELLNELSSIREFQSFNLLPSGGARMIATVKNSSERLECIVEPTRVALHCAHPEFDSGHFLDMLAEPTIRSCFSVLQVPVAVTQHYVVRKLASAATSDQDARRFLAEAVASLDPEHLKTLGRPLQAFGFRLFFPLTPDQPFHCDVKVESLIRDPKTIFLENKATFAMPVQRNQLKLIRENLLKTERFLTENVVGFFAQCNPGSGTSQEAS